jgi:hypothetical protein
VVAPGVGYLCDSEDDYVGAVRRLDEISPDRCRAHALDHFHYRRMARDYVDEFGREIARYAGCRSRR